MNQTTFSRYPAPLIVLHWLVAVLVLTAYATGGHPTREGLLGEIHVACGVAVAALLLLRLPLRLLLRRRIPQHSGELWQLRAAAAVQWALYGCMLLVPLTGWLALSAETAQFAVFGLDLPLAGAMPKFFGDVHETLGNVFIGLAGLHAAAALLHHFVQKDGVLKSMTFKK